LLVFPALTTMPPHAAGSRLSRLRDWARVLKRDVLAVFLAARDPRTPRAARLLAMAVAAYALSPIDLIPDFVPIVGYLDDLVIVPVGLWLVIRMLPPEVLATARSRAQALVDRPRSRIAAVLIVIVWILLAALLLVVGHAHWKSAS
jgi:uncharacterized membrane protein YkvA (DUF1232 family)